jgi:outer membrane protein, heavy metal efflux system
MCPSISLSGWRVASCVIFAALSAWSLAVAGSPLSFDAALKLAEGNAPSVAAQGDAVAAAKSSAVAAGRLPDPRLFVGVENLPVSGPPAWTLDEEPMTMGRIGVMQEVPNAAKRRAEVELADAAVAIAESGRAIERLRVRRETAIAWIRRYHFERKGALLGEFDRENRLLADGVSAQIAAGEATAPDSVMPRQEAAMLAQRRDELDAEIACGDGSALPPMPRLPAPRRRFPSRINTFAIVCRIIRNLPRSRR